uniref:RRM domain-containing protein n=1 Tax=Rhizophora mucronata TaxID=61149 RepID=A0A2P2MIB1_RHIMU
MFSIFYFSLDAYRYITYSREEEAIRCIQSVHGFVLDGRSLKYVCFCIWILFSWEICILQY